ncbi:MAG TPA: heparinase II/III family protein [Verrucomicrobiae bacterium]|nr:heparinase II/III family protein [Verrucomicrobiae bacterium]
MSLGIFSRRDAIKLMTLASAAICRPGSLMAEDVSGRNANLGAAAVSAVHPRLFYNAASLARLRELLATDPATDASLKKDGEGLVNAKLIPETAAMRGEGQHASYGEPGTQMSDMGLTLGLLFQVTGDRSYAERLREAMLFYANYVRWAGESFERRTPPWSSELDTAKFSFGYATGYDALHDYLSEADRRIISDAMVRLSVLPTLNDWVIPGKRIHSFDSMGHNWWGVCVAGAGLCALALLGDDPRAQGWIDTMDAGFEQWFNFRGNTLQNRVATFERSGPSYEGVSYTRYGVTEYLHYRLAWQNTYSGKKAARMEPLDHVARFFLYTLYPTSRGSLTVDFNDCTLGVDATETMLLLMACGLGSPESDRYLELVHTNPQSTLISLLRQPSSKMPAALDAPNSVIYPEMGWSIMRSSWENDATLLAMKSGYTWNHAHADAGSFILFKQGAPLIIDSGTCSYDRREYHEYYCQSRAHNVILFDGAGQPPDDFATGCKFSGRMHSLIDGLKLKYVYADATGPMARWFTRNYRHWLWSGDVILVIDDVSAHTAGQMDWLLHFAGKYEKNSDGSVSLKNRRAEALVKMVYPPATIREGTGLADHNPDVEVPYLIFSPDGPAQSGQFITAICLNPNVVPKFEVLERQNYLGIRVQTPDAVEELYLDLRATRSPNTIEVQAGDWVTDAYLLHIKWSNLNGQPVQRYFIGDGSYLRYKGRSVMESLSKRTACWAPGESMEVFSDNMTAPMQIAADARPAGVNWNHRRVAARYDAQSKLVSL